MSETGSTPRVVVVGAGAAGSLTALHLARTARRRGTPLEVVLLDPAAHRARGTAFGTLDERHLLNVPAGAMSALPEEPGHFVAWRARQHPELLPEPGVFAPRLEWARYLDETLGAAYGGDVPLGLRHLRVRAVGSAARRVRGPRSPPTTPRCIAPTRSSWRRGSGRPASAGRRTASATPPSSSPTPGRPALSTSYAATRPARPTSCWSAPA